MLDKFQFVSLAFSWEKGDHVVVDEESRLKINNIPSPDASISIALRASQLPPGKPYYAKIQFVELLEILESVEVYMKDIQFNDGNKHFNCRVNGICIKDNKIFLSKLKTDKYWTFVGGKVEFDETTDNAILREYKEEVGVDLQIDKLLALIEKFFELHGDSWHQYIFFYQLWDDNNALEFFEGEREVEDNKNAIYRWFDLAEIPDVPIKPDCSREILRNISSNIQHYINREN